jgi:hypothetical protein
MSQKGYDPPLLSYGCAALFAIKPAADRWQLGAGP